MAAMPTALANAQAQFYLFLRTLAQGEGLTANQDLVLNSTILPFDIAVDTPFYNDELFREYADRTFTGGVEGIKPNSAAFLAERFSSQYRVLLNLVTAQIDQNHPEIQNSLTDLRSQQKTASTALTTKIGQLEAEWDNIATSRGLVKDTVDYNMQYTTWLAQVRYADQIQTYTDDIDRIDAQMDATRRKVYSQSEIAALDNYGHLSSAYNIARPWTANIERSYVKQSTPLTDLMLADFRKLSPAQFDSSPLVFPIGDLIAFLSAQGVRGFDTSSYQYNLTSTQKSWNASGGGSFLGWSLGGGGGGSSSMTNSMSELNSLSISFANIAEYLADRSAWFNPGVLQDPDTYKLIKGRPEVRKLQYIGVSLIVARGTTLVLKFSKVVNGSDWTQSNFQASGGCSFLGCSFGGGGGSSSSTYSVSVDQTGTTVTIQDGDKVARVLGARVEPFLVGISAPDNQPLDILLERRPKLTDHLKQLQTGKMSYLDFQSKRIQAQEEPLERPEEK